MSAKVTRRTLAATLLAPVALAQAPAPETPASLLTTAKEASRRTAEALTKFAVPMDTEPALVFKP